MTSAARAAEAAEQALTRRTARDPWYRKSDGIRAIVEGFSGNVVLYRRAAGCELLRVSRKRFEELYNSPGMESAQ